MEIFIRHIELSFLRLTLKRGILISLFMYVLFFFYHLFISVQIFYPLLIAFFIYICFLGWFYYLFQKKKYNLSRLLFLYGSTLFFTITSFVLVGTETNNHYYLLIFSVLAVWMNHKESFISSFLFFCFTLFLFTAAEFSFFPDIAIIDYPEKLLKSEAIQNIVFSFTIVFYVSYLFNKASIKKEVQLAEKSEELQDANIHLRKSQEENEQQRETLLKLNTEMKSYLEQISEKNKALDITNKTKDKLFNIISHDLKNPLSSLTGLIELLNEQVSKNELDNLGTLTKGINYSANRFQTLTLDLLDWSRTQTGGFTPSISSFQLLKTANMNKDLFAPNLKEKNIELEINCNPDITIKADFNMFNTVVRNLVNNAVKFTHPKGRIKITSSELAKEYILSISDNGIGMNHDKVNNLSDFNKASSTYGTNNEVGSGLGLLVCFEFLKLNNCTLEVKSKEGKGSTFSIHIPR